jgi:aminoglycoside phosphotransferase (APT) family kinase protein
VTVAVALEPLHAWLAAKLEVPDVTIGDVTRHAEGFSWETWTFDASWPGGSRGLAIRIEPDDGLLAPYDVEEQYRVHEVVRRRSSVPMPELYWLELDPAVLGRRFYAMERLHGTVPVQWAGDDPALFPTPEARRALGRRFVEVQALIHAVDWRDLFADPGDPVAAARAQVERWAAFYEDSALVEVPLLRHAIGWLREHVACSGRLVLCHGDYRIGNFMVADGELVGVFDWELAHVGDPIEDVAYSGLPLWRGRGELLSQLLPAEEYFQLYRERTGLAVEPDVFRFWTVLGLLKAASVHLRAARAFEQGRTADLRLAALGHQVHFVLRLLARELEL